MNVPHPTATAATHATAIRLTVDGAVHDVEVDIRSTLLDTLRERVGVTTVSAARAPCSSTAGAT